MSFATPIAQLVHMLGENAPTDAILGVLRPLPVLSEVTDAEQRDLELIFLMYSEMLAYVQDQTYFGIQAGGIIRICIERFPNREAILVGLRRRFGEQPELSSELLSFYIVFSFAAGDYAELHLLMHRYLDERASAGVLDSTLMLAMRSLIITAYGVFSLSAGGALPESVRPLLRQNPPIHQAIELASRIETLIRDRCRSLRREQRDLHIMFALDDFVADRLNTTTKMFCDYFFVLAKHTDVQISVKIYAITRGYQHARMISIWDPPAVEDFVGLMAHYFGEEGRAAAEKINFSYADFWEDGEDYVGRIGRDLAKLRPDVCVTSLDRQNSFLEIALFELAPLLQIEIINNSGFVHHCDVLVPNGSLSEQRRREFHCVTARLPQIPFPIVSTVTKESLGFAADSYVLAVVAKEFPRRMELEGKQALSMAFAGLLVELQSRHPELALLLVGETPLQVEAWFAQAGVRPDAGRMRIIEFAQDLRATMLACDLVVNPPQRGGGRGIAIAVSDGVPVIIFDDADAANFVPSANQCTDLTAFNAKVEYYIALGCGFRELYIATESGEAPFSDAYNRNCALQFVEAAWTTRERGRARLGLPAEG